MSIQQRLRVSSRITASIAQLRPLARFTFRQMSSNHTSHEERTATQRREAGIENVKLRHIEQVNETIRLMRLYSIDKDHTIKVGTTFRKATPTNLLRIFHHKYYMYLSFVLVLVFSEAKLRG